LQAVEPIAQALAAAAAPTRADRLRLARVRLWLGRSYYLLGEPDRANEYYGYAMDLARAVGDDELVASGSHSMGVLTAMQGYYGKAEGLLEVALPPLERAANWMELIRVLGYLGISRSARGRYPLAQRTALDALRRAIELDNATAIALSHMCLVVIHMYGGDWRKMVAESLTTIDLADQSGDRVTAYIGTLGLALAESRLGHHVAAREAIDRAIASGVEAVPENRAAFASEVALSAGDPELALARAQEAVQAAERGGVISAEALAHRIWAEALVRLAPDRWDEIETHFALSARLFEAADCRAECGRSYFVWGLAARERDAATAAECFTQALFWLQGVGMPNELARVHAAVRALDRTPPAASPGPPRDIPAARVPAAVRAADA
jgi:tetratricopeptide (TPR) repeat protein